MPPDPAQAVLLKWHDADCTAAVPIQGLKESSAKIIKVDMPAPPPKSTERTMRLRENGKSYGDALSIHRCLMQPSDLWLSTLLESLPGSNYTVIYTTSPSASTNDVLQEESGSYQMDNSMSPLGHLDLKRDLSARQQAPKNVTLVDGPLFERYQYLTPGKIPWRLCTQ